MKRQALCLWLIGLFALGILSGLTVSFAAPFPSGSIKILVPAGASGSLGTEIRTIAPYLEKNLGVSMIIEYVTGAEGMIAYNKFYKEKPDGYTILYFNSLSALPLELTRDTAKYEVKKFSPIAAWNVKNQAFIVHPDSWKTFPEFLNEAKKRKTSLAGTGGHSILNYRLMETGFGIKFNFVPYESSAEGFSAVAGKHIEAVITYTATPKPMIRAGKLRALAILASKRDPILPEVPSFEDLGYGDVQILPTYGVFAAPPNTPKEIVATFEKAVSKTITHPEFVKAAENVGIATTLATSSEVMKLTSEQYELLNKYKEFLK